MTLTYSAEMKRYNKAYLKLLSLPLVYSIGSQDANIAGKAQYWDSFNWKNLISEIASACGVTIPNDGVRNLARLFMQRLDGMYFPIDFRRTSFSDGTPDHAIVETAPIGTLGNFTIKLQLAAISSKGEGISSKFTAQLMNVANFAGVEDDEQATLFTDSLVLLGNIIDILVTRFSRYTEVQEAYNAIPIKNETHSDTTTTTPNLTTESAETFNPVNTPSSRDRLKTTTTQTGDSVTTVNRANGVSAKDQADIVKDLPNLANQIISDVKALLIDPRTINDMFDYGLADGYYVEW